MAGWDGSAAPADLPGAGDAEWATMTGINASHPLLGGGPRLTGIAPLDSNAHLGSMASTLSPEAAGVAEGDVSVFDDWRDLFDFKNSPGPWVLLMALLAIGFVQLRVTARGVGASLG